MRSTLTVRPAVRAAAARGIQDLQFARDDYYLPPEFAAPRRFFATTGLSVTRDGESRPEDLTLAARNALLNMIDHLQDHGGWTRQQAYAICSVAVDLKVSEVVDVPSFVVSASSPSISSSSRGPRSMWGARLPTATQERLCHGQLGVAAGWVPSTVTSHWATDWAESCSWPTARQYSPPGRRGRAWPGAVLHGPLERPALLGQDLADRLLAGLGGVVAALGGQPLADLDVRLGALDEAEPLLDGPGYSAAEARISTTSPSATTLARDELAVDAGADAVWPSSVRSA